MNALCSKIMLAEYGIMSEICYIRFQAHMSNLGIFISNKKELKGTFLDGDSEAVGIMMHASGKSVLHDFRFR